MRSTQCGSIRGDPVFVCATHRRCSNCFRVTRVIRPPFATGAAMSRFVHPLPCLSKRTIGIYSISVFLYLCLSISFHSLTLRHVHWSSVDQPSGVKAPFGYCYCYCYFKAEGWQEMLRKMPIETILFLLQSRRLLVPVPGLVRSTARAPQSARCWRTGGS